MEASAIHAPAALGRFPLGGGLFRLRSDEQLIAAFRSGNDEAFRILHDRYRQRLFAYVRQMLSSCSRQDAEDVLQDVFVRAYGSLRNDNREMNVRAWLYRVAHNRCIDHLRRPIPPAAEIFEVSRKPLQDPVEEAQRRDDLRQLVVDVGQLPEQQRSALLMREIDGMTYADLANALDVTVAAVKSLLVRARVGLVEAAEARDADCVEIQADLLRAYDRGVKASGRARKHMRSCDGCTTTAATCVGCAARSPRCRRSASARSRSRQADRPRWLRRRAAAGGGSAAVAGGAAPPRPRPRARSPRSSARPRSRPAARSRSTTRFGVSAGEGRLRDRPRRRTPHGGAHRAAVVARARRAAAAAGRASVPARDGQRGARRQARAQDRSAQKAAAAAPIVAVKDDAAPAVSADPQVETGGVRAPDATPVVTTVPRVAHPDRSDQRPEPAGTAARHGRV